MKRRKHSFTRDELIKNVEEETPLGEKLAEMHLAYLKSFIKKERDKE